LNDSAIDSEVVGTWSPDGRRFAEITLSGSKLSLVLIKVGSLHKPIVIRNNIDSSLPDWYPTRE
jgi:hypothetical protein